MGIVISENLTKKFKDKFAVNNLSFILEKGKIYGILGKNGAGKSTLLKLLVGLYFPNSGSIKVFGKQPEAGDKRIGYLSENLAAYFHLSAYDNVDIVSKMSGIKMNKNQIYNILEEVNLENFAHKKVSDFSLGMKRRLQLALTIFIGQHELLILDEPTNGLDISGMSWFKEKVSALNKKGITIILSSHSIKEMQEIITDYIILHKGEIIKMANIKEIYKTNKKLIKIEDNKITEFINMLNDRKLFWSQRDRNEFIIDIHNSNYNIIEDMNSKKIYPLLFQDYVINLEEEFEQLIKEQL